MKRMELKAHTGTCEIAIGEKLENVKNYYDTEKVAIITDMNVRKLYGNRFPKGDIIEIGLGEASKTLETVEMIYNRFTGMRIDRSSFVVGMGGGIVTDVAGYAASTYLRGIGFGFVPTTLLAQVDAAIGGKNGVNFSGYKNLIGTTRQPKFSICDPEVLKTLPEREIRCGFAEVIKYAAISDPGLMLFLEKNAGKALGLDNETINHVIEGSIATKVSIVEKDEMDNGERMKLNFGHTVGHAIEKTAGIPHGEAVAIGMAAAADVSVAKGMLKKEDAERLKNLIRLFGLPVSAKMDVEGCIEAIDKDKKRSNGKIRMVLLGEIGKAIVKDIEIREIESALRGIW